MPDVAAEWWIHQENRTPIGPLTTDEVLRRIAAGAVQRNTLACDGPGRRWQPVWTFPAFATAFGSHAARPPGVTLAAGGYVPPGVGAAGAAAAPPPPPPPPSMHLPFSRQAAPAQTPSSPKPISARQAPPPPPLPSMRKPVSEPPAPQPAAEPPAPSRPLPTFSVPPPEQTPEPLPAAQQQSATAAPAPARGPVASSSSQRPLEPGAVLAERYRVERHIARGGFSDLYVAHDLLLDSQVALKIPLPGDDAAFLDALVRRTCSAWDRLGDAAPDRIVRLKALVPLELEGKRTSLIVMELMPGGTIDDFARSKGGGRPRTAEQLSAVFAMFLQACRAVGALHGLGMLHRDIKPTNFLLDAQQRCCKLADFETVIAADQVDDAKVGTGAYRAPECRTGRHSAASDVFALGATLFQLLTGELPFEDARGARREVAPDVASLNPMVPEEVARLVERCLEPDPSRRPRHAEDLVEDLLRTGVTGETAAGAPSALARLLLSSLRPEELSQLAAALERRGFRSPGATAAQRQLDLIEEYCHTAALDEVLGDQGASAALQSLAGALALPPSEAASKSELAERIASALGFVASDRQVPGLESARARLVRLGFDLSQTASLDEVLANLRSSLSTVKKAVDLLARFYAQLLFGAGARSRLAQASGAQPQERLAIGQLAVALRTLCTTPPASRLPQRVEQAFCWPLFPSSWFDRLDRFVAVRNDVVRRRAELSLPDAMKIARDTSADALEIVSAAASSPHAPGVLRIVGRQQDAYGRYSYLGHDDLGRLEKIYTSQQLSVGQSCLFHPLGRTVRINPLVFPFELEPGE